MEFVASGDLQRYLITPMAEKDSRQIISQLLEGLQFMHEHGFAHRDMKPQVSSPSTFCLKLIVKNVLVVKSKPDWWVKIADFGISKRTGDNTALRTQIGTPAYAAPEVLGIFTLEELNVAKEEIPSYTVAVDIWSLGMIMYRMLTIDTPFADPRELAMYVTMGNPLPKALLRKKEVSSLGVDFIEKCLAASAKKRPSATDLLQSQWITKSL
jgi:serine/threonine protein kinase